MMTKRQMEKPITISKKEYETCVKNVTMINKHRYKNGIPIIIVMR